MDGLRQLTQEQMALLAEPNRLAVLRRLMAGPATLSQLARAFGTSPAWVRHHMLRLRSAGLVELAEERTTRNYTEKYYRATAPAFSMHALVKPDEGDRAAVVALGSHDLALEALARIVNDGPARTEIVPVAIGSLDGLVALRQGLADIAGCHLLDPGTGEYNIPYVRHLFPDRQVSVVTMVEREQGMMLAPGNPLKIGGLEDLGRSGVRLANRNGGSGTRLWLDRRLRELDLSAEDVAGYENELPTHTAVAEAIAAGEADLGLGIRAAAEAQGLAFVPLFEERYDLVFAADRRNDPALEPLLQELCGGRFRDAAQHLGGYQVGHTGDEENLAG